MANVRSSIFDYGLLEFGMKMLLWALLGSSIVSLTACGDKEAEICNDSVDNDGNGFSDCYDEACSTDAVCIDADGDGFALAEDCNDENALTYPGADEICDEDDNNCDGSIDENPIDGSPYYGDEDLDGYGNVDLLLKACSESEGVADNAEDCDDSDANINPDADEICDEVDNNCDNVVDSDAIDRTTFYRDNDGDGVGIEVGSQDACDVPDGFAVEFGDCDDNEPVVYPGAEEVCDGLDNDCDGTVDQNATDGSDYFADMDADGFGDPTMPMSSCDQPVDYVVDNTDCNDTSSDANPNQLEVCDEIDNDCDGDVDDADSSVVTASGSDWYIDVDGDGQGDETSISTESCSPPVDSTTGNSYVDNADDCDDMDLSIYSGAPETCNSIDDDCDGMVDDKASGGMTYYPDADGDGFGDDSVPYISCGDPSSLTLAYVTIGGDCDDSDSGTYPGATDVCDGIDQNCSGDESDATGTGDFYLDLDEDGYGDVSNMMSSCEAPEGYVSNADDCNDLDETVFLGADELCDGIDNDCDGDVDQDDVDFDSVSLLTYYADQDQDGYGDDNSTVLDCAQPAGYVLDGGDCNDSRQDLDGDGVFDGAVVNPGMSEIYYDGIDADCDGMSDYDQDGDGEDALGTCTDTSYLSLSDCESSGACDNSSYDNEGDCVTGGGIWEYNLWTSFNVNGTDCDDTSASANNADIDGDGFTSCSRDCNEEMDLVDGHQGLLPIGFYTFPGAGYNEADPSICITDIDGDGYGGVSTIGCMDFYVFDTYGDGWNGNGLAVYEDGVLMETIANQNLDGISYNSGAGESQTVTYCAMGQTSELSVAFVDGSYNTEIQFELFDSSGSSLGAGQGTGTYDVIFDGVTYTDGDTIFTYSAPQGSDCDDTDANIAAEDADGDGAIDCVDDCDSSDPTLNADDLDGDGYSTCDGDCNESVDDLDGDGVLDGAAFNPGMVDSPYDGVDDNCDGLDDFDADGDGDVVSGWDCDGDGVLELSCDLDSDGIDDFVAGGDCNDNNAEISSVAEEVCDGLDNDCDTFTDDQDPDIDPLNLNTYYEDVDGDGYGSDAVTLESCNPTGSFVELDGDCNDDPNLNGAQFNPGMIDTPYDGVDSDCDGLDDFDADGDGEMVSEYDCDGDGVPETSCDLDGDGIDDFFGGTDCDDTSSTLNSADLDGDGYSTCDGDCNEDTTLNDDGAMVGSFTYPGAAYNESATLCLTDSDGDGYAGFGAFGCYDLILIDSFGDGWNGNALEIFEDGVQTASATLSTGTSGVGQFCPEVSTQALAFYFTDGSYNSEISFTVTDSNGDAVMTGQGTGTYDVIVNGVTYTDGDMIYSDEVPQGNDCDDSDPAVNLEDLDGDGVSACASDCDDTDPLNAGSFTEDCFDGQDNDCDGIADCDDSDCETTCFEVDCTDGIDGDADGFIDCDDSDCDSDTVCTEEICDDNQDEDLDGLIDCADPDCAIDYDCQVSCVDMSNDDLGSALGNAVATGSNIGMLDDQQGDCTLGENGEDVTFWWTAPLTGTFTFDTTNSTYDTVLYIQEDCLTDEQMCNDDVDFDGGDISSSVEVDLEAGDSVLVVIDGYDEFAFGDYTLDVTLSSEVDCTDGQDEDGDGAIDCADVDCAADPTCASSTCPSFDVGTDTGMSVLTGDLTQAPTDNFQATCSTEGGNDLVVSWEADTTGCATFSTGSGSMDTILTVFDACPDVGGIEMACNDDESTSLYTSEVQYDVVSGDVYYIGIDSWAYSQSDEYSLDISIQSGVSCN